MQSSSNQLNLAYILGASHSGTTLLAMLLGSHPDIITVGELKATNLGNVEHYRCSCRARIQECPFWQQVHAAMLRRGIAFDIGKGATNFNAASTKYVRTLLAALHRGRVLEAVRDIALYLSPTWRKVYPDRQRVNEALARSILEISGRSVLVDSSKIGLRLKYLLRNAAFNIRVIRMIRDGRGVALAHMDPAEFADAQDPALRDGGTGGRRESERLTIEQAAYEWKRSNEEADNLLRRVMPSSWTEVRYEELCHTPRTVLHRLYEFLEVDPWRARRDLRFTNHHVLGNGMRFDLTPRIAADERWTTLLTAEQLRVFDAVAGRLNRCYGYV